MWRYFLFTILLNAMSCNASKQSVSQEQLQQISFSNLENLMEKESRPIAVFLHADWCKFCRNMEQTTLRKSTVIELLNENYYYLPFDGEQKEVLTFRGHKFHYQPNGRNSGTHELAASLGTIDGVLAYPTFVILNEAYEITFQYSGFLTEAELKRVLRAQP
ncbi:MAG: thioredoxin family protein [Saprospiraceae bacterium]